MGELEINHTYLIKLCNSSEMILSITVLKVMNMAYYVRFNKGLNSSDEWMEKKYLSSNYNIIEDISKFVDSDTTDIEKIKRELEFINTPTTKTEWIQCHICKGFGTIPDSNSTAGNKPCPLCNGNRVIAKITQIS